MGTPETAKVLDMVFVLFNNGQKVTESPPITATLARSQIIDGKLVDVYKASWSYYVPSTAATGIYRLELEIHCAWKENYFETRELLRQSLVKGAADNLPSPTPVKDEGGFSSLIRNFLAFLGFGVKPTSITTQTMPTPTPTIPFAPLFVTVVAPRGKTIQLGTFFPAVLPVAKGCTELYFQVTN